MRIAHADAVAFRPVSGHREGDITFKRLLQGTPDAADNFELSIIRNRGAYYTPRHRHNFEQIRLVLSGVFSYAGRKVMHTGDAGYFPEGTWYGPQTVSDCETLIVQYGGPSGSGFLDYDALHEGHLAMARVGSFERGVFRRGEGSNRPPGSRKNQDGYEAIWEFVRGRRVSYPPARYDEPVIAGSAACPWRPTAAAGIEAKAYGAFDGGARMEHLRLAPGAALAIDAAASTQLLYVEAGTGHADGAPYRPTTAIAVDRGGTGRLVAETETVLFRMGLTAIEAGSARAAA